MQTNSAHIFEYVHSIMFWSMSLYNSTPSFSTKFCHLLTLVWIFHVMSSSSNVYVSWKFALFWLVCQGHLLCSPLYSLVLSKPKHHQFHCEKCPNRKCSPRGKANTWARWIQIFCSGPKKDIKRARRPYGYNPKCKYLNAPISIYPNSDGWG